MIIHVQYRDKKYDYVNSLFLEGLIQERTIRQFFRPSEKKWINIDLDPIRGTGGKQYNGAERRRVLNHAA
jgi:hypothetical protein